MTNSPNIMANSFISCAKHNPRGEIVVYGNRRITWGELKPRIFKIANGLIKLGLKKGDKVALMFHNTPEFMESNWAINVAGGIPAPMNYRYIQTEIEFQGNHSDAKIMIYDSIWGEKIEAAAANMPQITHFICRGKSGLKNAIDYEKFVNSNEDIDPCIATDWEDIAVMIYTGGTTGYPKGVMLTYNSYVEMFTAVMASAAVRSLTMDLSPEKHKKMVELLPIPGAKFIAPLLRTKFVKNYFLKPKFYQKVHDMFHDSFTNPDSAKKGYKNINRTMYPSMPFFHIAAYQNLVMAALIGNFCFHLPDNVSFEPSMVLKIIQDEEIKNVSNVPTGWKKLVSCPEINKYDLSSVRMALTGGGACDSSLKKEILKYFKNAIILDAFGQTEMTPVTSFRLDSDPDKIQDRSVGKSLVEVRVVDENGKDVKQGTTGEILYKSKTVMKGYYKDEKATSEVLKDGWFHSGDLGYIDENGEIRVVDRKKECINTGGEKVYPLEVEEIIHGYDGVDDVCVIGVPDPEWGYTVRAIVQMMNGIQVKDRDIIDYCKGKLAGYKIPRSVIFVNEMPRSPVGKVLRQQIRDIYGKPGK